MTGCCIATKQTSSTPTRPAAAKGTVALRRLRARRGGCGQVHTGDDLVTFLQTIDDFGVAAVRDPHLDGHRFGQLNLFARRQPGLGQHVNRACYWTFLSADCLTRPAETPSAAGAAIPAWPAATAPALAELAPRGLALLWRETLHPFTDFFNPIRLAPFRHPRRRGRIAG